MPLIYSEVLMWYGYTRYQIRTKHQQQNIWVMYAYLYVYLTESMCNVCLGLQSSKNAGSSNLVIENVLFSGTNIIELWQNMDVDKS